MNSSAWLRVYHHEISRRRRLQQEQPTLYKKVCGHNPKKLNECCEDEHVWVPATTLWIHDNAKGAYKIDGYLRRGLREAAPYRDNGFRVIPQMCWNCVHTREMRSQIVSWSERRKTLADHIQTDKVKKRGRQGRNTMIEDYDELEN